MKHIRYNKSFGEQIKILSWSIGGFKSALTKRDDLKEYIKNDDPDVICL